MIERYEVRDERGRVTGHVLKESPQRATFFTPASRERQPDSPLVDAICMIAGLIMLAATGLLLWAMATAT
jgi:hypothetical protein